jgi:hypothetical protein
MKMRAKTAPRRIFEGNVVRLLRGRMRLFYFRLFYQIN